MATNFTEQRHQQGKAIANEKALKGKLEILAGMYGIRSEIENYITDL